MSRVLLDHNLPRPLRHALPGHDVSTARHLGWDALRNGELLAAAERAGFEVLVTADRSIRHQQELAGRPLAVVELPTNAWRDLRDHGALIADAISSARVGHVAGVDLPKPPRSHRGPPRAPTPPADAPTPAAELAADMAAPDRGGALPPTAAGESLPTVPRLRSLDDLAPGDAYDLGALALSREEVVAFASRYDPQPFHLDEAAARESPLFRELVASGLHTLSAVFGRLISSGLIAEISLGGTGMDVRWPAALRPGEAVRVRVEVVGVAPSRTRPDRGRARLRYVATREADGVVVLRAEAEHVLRR